MAKNEQTSKNIASIAAKGMRNPGSLTNKQIRQVSASALTQAPNKGGSKK